MQNLRESLLSPSPRGISDKRTLDGAFTDRHDAQESAARGELEELRGSGFYNRTWVVTTRYCSVGDGVDSLEGYLHSLWHIYYQVARYTSHKTTDQDRLVLDIIRIQGKGPLTRPASGVYGINIARTIEGTLWNDLPFLVTDMTEFWVDNCATMSSAHRLNFASFLAKLASTRVSKDKVCQIALLLFRNTFEEARELRGDEKLEKEDPTRSIRDLDLVQLLPSACAWIKEAGYNLVLLSDVWWNDCHSAIGRGGDHFIESELGKRSPSGFTPWRWMYWLKRLHEIQQEAKRAEDKQVVEYVTDAIEFMVQSVEDRNSEILRAYQAGGDVLHEEKHLSCLKKVIDGATSSPDEAEQVN